jgi:hypothetical protein
MCNDFMSVARARCPDCREVIEVPYSWCVENRGFLDLKGRLDDAFAHQLLHEHARRMPILHPTLLPDQHLTRRPA